MNQDSRSFWAWLTLTVGGMIVLLAGPCTLLYAGGALVALLRGVETQFAGFVLTVALVVGGIPTAGGVVLVLKGLESLRRLREPPA